MTRNRAINPDASVSFSLPDYALVQPILFHALAEASGQGRTWHFCAACGGWVEGLPGHRRENTMTPLAGRNGSAYSCRRCGAELAFVGSVS